MTRTHTRSILGILMGCLVLVGAAVLHHNWALQQAQHIAVWSEPVDTFNGANVGESVDGLVWLGGLAVDANHREFGEFSGISFLDSERFVMVSDRGYFLSGSIVSSENLELAGVADTVIAPIEYEDMEATDRAPDAEAVAVVFKDGVPALVRVGFERFTRVADYMLEDGRPVGAGKEFDIPTWLETVETNETIEAVCIATLASPLHGSTLVIAEDILNHTDRHAAAIVGQDVSQALTIRRQGDFKPTACRFLPNGDLLVLLRAQNDNGFSMQVKRIPASLVRPGGVLDGPAILSSDNSGNMEGMDVRRMPEGDLRLILVSDSGGSGGTESLLLQFTLPLTN